MSEFTHVVSVILDVLLLSPRRKCSGSPDVAAFSIPLDSLKYMGHLARVDSGWTLASSGLLDPPNHAVASCPPPIQGANIVGPSVA